MYLNERTGTIYFISDVQHGDSEVRVVVFRSRLMPLKVERWRAALRTADQAVVTSLVGSERFHATRHALAANSDYFRSIFSQPRQESQNKEIGIDQESPEAFEALLVYIYADYVLPLSPMQMVELAVLADLYTV